jgi:hypothetical protein
MWRSVALVALVGTAAFADRKEAPPDTPKFADVEAFTLDLQANAAAPRCQPLAYSIRLNVTTWAWVRSIVTCSDAKGAPPPKTARETGVVPKPLRATVERQYYLLDERVPRICKDSFPWLAAIIVAKGGATARLVDNGCETNPRLRELAATLAALKP